MKRGEDLPLRRAVTPPQIPESLSAPAIEGAAATERERERERQTERDRETERAATDNALSDFDTVNETEASRPMVST